MTRSARIERDSRLLESYKLYMERLNSELSVHWTRINILVVAITAALGGYGLLWKEALKSCDSRDLLIMTTIVGFLTAILAVIFRSILHAGKNWCDIAEVRVVALERELWRKEDESSIYMCHENDTSWKHTLGMYPKITDVYKCMLTIVIYVLLITSAIALFYAFSTPKNVSCCCGSSEQYAAVIAGNWNVLLALVIVTIPVVALECYMKCAHRHKCLRKSDCDRKTALNHMTRSVQEWTRRRWQVELLSEENEVAESSSCKCNCHKGNCPSCCS